MKEKNKSEKLHFRDFGKGKKAIFIIAAVFSLYGIAVVLSTGFSNWFNFAFLAAGAFLFIVCRFWEKLMKIKRPFRIAALVVIAAVFVHFVYAETQIVSASITDAPENAEWVIILGAKVNGNVPSVEFNRRITAAKKYACDNASARIVTTGGKGFDEIMPEGEAAKDSLVSQGIDESRIIVENTSTSTLENLSNSLQLIKDAGGSGDDSVVIVSSVFHLYRAKKIASECGFTEVSGLGSVGRLVLLPHYYVREYVAYLADVFGLA